MGIIINRVGIVMIPGGGFYYYPRWELLSLSQVGIIIIIWVGTIIIILGGNHHLGIIIITWVGVVKILGGNYHLGGNCYYYPGGNCYDPRWWVLSLS